MRLPDCRMGTLPLWRLVPPCGAEVFASLTPARHARAHLLWRMMGPTTWQAVYRIRPSPAIAVGCALLLALVLFKIGDSESYEFIYFHF